MWPLIYAAMRCRSCPFPYGTVDIAVDRTMFSYTRQPWVGETRSIWETSGNGICDRHPGEVGDDVGNLLHRTPRLEPQRRSDAGTPGGGSQHVAAGAPLGSLQRVGENVMTGWLSLAWRHWRR